MRGFAFLMALLFAAPTATAQDNETVRKLFEACQEKSKDEPCKALEFCRQAQAEAKPRTLGELNALTRSLKETCIEEVPEVYEGPEAPIDRSRLPEGQSRILPGTFRIGSPKDEQWSLTNETPHKVELTRPFAAQNKEVTQKQWQDITGLPTPSHFQSCGLDCPVESVTWYEAIAYANALSTKERMETCYTNSEGSLYTMDDARLARPVSWPKGLDCAGWRLPTEAEWEYAARAGSSKATYKEGTLDIEAANKARFLDNIARYAGNSSVNYGGGYACGNLPLRQYASKSCGPRPGGEKLANAWGLYDVLGNVWEWTWNTYQEEYDLDTTTDPIGPKEGDASGVKRIETAKPDEPKPDDFEEGDESADEESADDDIADEVVEESVEKPKIPEGGSIRGAVGPPPPPMVQDGDAPELQREEGGAARAPSRRVTRGCSWISNARHCRAAYRGNLDPASRSFNQGFRLVRTLR